MNSPRRREIEKIKEMFKNDETAITYDGAFPVPSTESQPKKEKNRDYVQWSRVGESTYFPEEDHKMVDKLPPGIFEIHYSEQKRKYFALKKELNLDELFILPDPIQEKVIADIKKFWANQANFIKYKYAFRRGILLWGRAGNGKSSIINLLCSELITKHKGVVFFLQTPDDLDPFIQFVSLNFKQIEPETRILCIIEDIENFCKRSNTESQLLNLLDGMNQMDNIVYIASTNYPEDLKERILNRPGRFDSKYQIMDPNAKIRKHYLKKKLMPEDLEKIDLKNWVKETKGLTISHLGEVVKSVFCLENTFEDTVKQLKEMSKKISSNDYNPNSKGSVGFNSSPEDEDECDDDWADMLGE